MLYTLFLLLAMLIPPHSSRAQSEAAPALRLSVGGGMSGLLYTVGGTQHPMGAGFSLGVSGLRLPSFILGLEIERLGLGRSASRSVCANPTCSVLEPVEFQSTVVWHVGPLARLGEAGGGAFEAVGGVGFYSWRERDEGGGRSDPIGGLGLSVGGSFHLLRLASVVELRFEGRLHGLVAAPEGGVGLAGLGTLMLTARSF